MSKTFEVIFKEFHNSETFVVSKTMLEDYKAKAALEERERIIKLIDNGSAGCDGEGAHYYCGPICDIDKLIALIKGENK